MIRIFEIGCTLASAGWTGQARVTLDHAEREVTLSIGQETRDDADPLMRDGRATLSLADHDALIALLMESRRLLVADADPRQATLTLVHGGRAA